MGIIKIEEDEMYPLTDETAANISASIKSNIPSTPQTNLTRDDIAKLDEKSQPLTAFTIPG